MRSFGTEDQCSQAVKRARWPTGFWRPRCVSAAHCIVDHGTRKLFQCNSCRHQTSLIAGTLFASTKLPLTSWFLAIYLISQAKTGLSSLALKRHFGVSHPTAWLMHHKICRARAPQATGTHVTNDGLSCFAAAADAGCLHLPIVVGTRKPRVPPKFMWVNTVLGKLKPH